VVNRVRGAGLVEKALHQILVGDELALEDLHRGFAAEQWVFREIHRPHAALAK
jgi:hypothetical protein